MLETVLIGRTPLGSGIRAAVLGVVITLFWRLLLSETWHLFVVSLVSVLAIVIAGHFVSHRDDFWTSGPGEPDEPPPGRNLNG